MNGSTYSLVANEAAQSRPNISVETLAHVVRPKSNLKHEVNFSVFVTSNVPSRTKCECQVPRLMGESLRVRDKM